MVKIYPQKCIILYPSLKFDGMKGCPIVIDNKIIGINLDTVMKDNVEFNIGRLIDQNMIDNIKIYCKKLLNRNI